MLKKSLSGRLCAVLLCVTTVFCTACGKMPDEFPDISPDAVTTGEVTDFKVNFFFQNNENTYCIKQNGTAANFFRALSGTLSNVSSDSSRTYILNFDAEKQAYGMTEYDRTNFQNLTWEEAMTEYSKDGSLKDSADSFYVRPSLNQFTLEKRTKSGMLQMFTDAVKQVNPAGFHGGSQEAPPEAPPEEAPVEEEAPPTVSTEFFDPEALNVMFTDLSEPNLAYMGENIFNYYTSDNKYSACLLALPITVNEGEDLYFQGKDNALQLTTKKSNKNRMYYLLMTGPSAKLVTFIKKLSNNLEVSEKMKKDKDYYISDLTFTIENFDKESDVAFLKADSKPELASLSGDEVFENVSVRLERKTDRESKFDAGSILRDTVLEYRYQHSEPSYAVKGYQNTDTLDFALNLDLDKEVRNREMVPATTELFYVFGKPTVYYQNSENIWTEMDPVHKERFFKVLPEAQDNGTHLTIINDNADECDIHNIYVTVPILQKATVDQLISENPNTRLGWVYNDCTFSEKNGIKEEAQRTFMFHQFYIKLFDLKLEGAIENNGELPAEKKDMYTQVDELHILIEDVHQ